MAFADTVELSNVVVQYFAVDDFIPYIRFEQIVLQKDNSVLQRTLRIEYTRREYH